jgi:hypothetical protein
MSIKQLKDYGLALAMTAAVAMVVGACSSDDNMVDNGAADGATAARSVTVTVGAGIADDGATRSAVVNGTDAQTGKPTHTLKFTSGDRLYVFKEVDNGYVAGMLTMVGSPTNDGKNATFTGEVKAYYFNATEMEYNFGADPLEGTTATLVHNGLTDFDYSFYNGLIEFESSYANDVETLMTNWLKVTGYYAEGGYTLASNETIINCTVTGLAASKGYLCSLYAEDGSAGSFPFTTDADGNGCIAFSTVYKPGEHDWELKFKEVNNNYFASISFGHGTLDEGKIYNVRRHWNGTAFEKTIPLETVTSDITVPDGYTLTGELATPVKISIAAGATVTLAGVTIDGKTLNSEESWDYNWSGLTCLGNANIVLADETENTVKYFYGDYAGIEAGPEGTTLTISGGTGTNAGKLTAEGIGSAGIGCGHGSNCGDITISGGDITASSLSGAGIGSGGWNTCGAITINGGTVTASSLSGAGIGSGQKGTCGDITISAYKVMAESTGSGVGIGCGHEGNCGDITISAGDGFVSLSAKKGIEVYKPIGLSVIYVERECGKITLFGTVIYDPNDTNGKDDKDYKCDDVGMICEIDYNTWIFKPHGW